MSADVQSGGFRGFLAAPGLRIAIPTWGRAAHVGANLPKRPALSREELASLFEGDLRPGARAPVSEAERQRRVNLRLRRALYG